MAEGGGPVKPTPFAVPYWSTWTSSFVS